MISELEFKIKQFKGIILAKTLIERIEILISNHITIYLNQNNKGQS